MTTLLIVLLSALGLLILACAVVGYLLLVEAHRDQS